MFAQPEPHTIIFGAASPPEIVESMQATEQSPLPEDIYREIEVLCD
jgi:hypothetical protein